MTNMKPKLTTKLRHISRGAPKRVIALVLTFLFAFNAASVLEAFPAYAEGESQTAGESTVQTSEPTASVTNDDLQISGSNSFGNMLATKVNDYQNGGDEDEYTEGYSVIGIEMNGKTSVVEYRAKDDCSLVVAVYDDDGAKMLGSGNTTVTVDKQSAEVEISIDEMPQYYLVKAFLVNPANNYPLCDACVNEDYTEENNQVTLSNLQSDEEYFVCGKDNVITFTVNVSGNPDSVKLYKNDTDLVGDMHDDGLNGDETADDGKYSVVVSENINSSDTVTCDYFASVAHKRSNNVSLYYFPRLTNEMLPQAKEDVLTLQQTIINIEKEYDDDSGCISENDVQEVFSQIRDKLDQYVNNGTVLHYKIEQNSMYIKMTNGACLVYSPVTSLDTSANGNNDLCIWVFQPNITIKRNSFYTTAESIDSILDNCSYSNSQKYEGKNVTLDTIKSFGSNQVIIWNGHGNYDTKNHSYMVTGETTSWNSLSDELNDDMINNRIVLDISKEDDANQKICVTSEYIDFHCGNLSNDLFILCVCCSMFSDHLAQSLINKHASAVLGFSYYVYTGYAEDIANDTLKNMTEIDEKTGDYYTLKDALSLSTEKYGVNDAEWSETRWVRTKTIEESAKPKIFPVNNETANNYRLANVIKPGDIVDSGKCGDNITYTLYGDGRLLLSGSGAMWDYDKREDVPWYKIRKHIKAVGFDGNITHIGNRIFGDCSNLTTISIPSTVTSIGDAAFSECTGLTELTILDSVTSIGTAAFSDCRGLTNITVPYFATNIGDFVFGNCSGLTQAIIQSSSPTIKKMMFANCSSLKAVYIPKTVTSVGDSAFLKCDNLTDVYYSGSQSEWNNISISNMNNSALTNATLHCSGTDNGTVLQSGKCGDNITYTLYENGLLELDGSGEMYNYKHNSQYNSQSPWYNNSLKIKKIELNGMIASFGEYAFHMCSNLTSITIPDSVTYIGAGAFDSCSNLTSITIPDSVTFVGACAFLGCSKLTSITLPKSVTTVGEAAFYSCSKLTSIYVSEDNRCFSSDDGVLFNKDKTKTIACPNCKKGNMTIPATVIEIGNCSFYGCNNITSIIIPNTVNSIGKYAFYYCSKLTDVYYTGTQEEWANISIDSYENGNSYFTNATIHYNYTPASSGNASLGGAAVFRTQATNTIQTATFDNLIPNESYLFVVSKSSDLDNMLDASNLLFIDEKTAGNFGSLTFSYIPREDYEGAVVKIFGPVNPSVTLDKTSATLKKSEKLTITATVDEGHSANDVVWSSSNEKIATVSKGQVTAVGFGDAEISAKLDDCTVKCVVSVVPDLDFTILGASIRLSEPYGIRFGIQLGKGGDYANVKIVDYGTIMKPTELLDGEDLTLETGNVQKIPAKVIYSENDAMKIYTGVLINIPTTYFDTAISGRGYFIYEDENGVNHTVYTDIVSMSFNDVVNAAYQKYTSLPNPTDAQKEIIARLEVLRAMSVND